MRKFFRVLVTSVVILSGLVIPKMSAEAAYAAGADTTVASNKASIQYLMGSELFPVVNPSYRKPISEVNTAGWAWLDASSDLKTLLTSATTPTGVAVNQSTSQSALSDNYYKYSNTSTSYIRDAANTVGYRGPKTNQSNPTATGAKPIDWSTGSKLPGGGLLTKVRIFDNSGNLVPNARFRIQMLGQDTTDNKFKVLGNGTGTSQFAPSNAKPSFTFYDCDPSASSSCAPLAAADTAGGVNPTFNETTAGAGEAFAQTNSSGEAYVWATLAGTVASNLFDFQIRVSDAPATVTTFPGDLDYSHVFPAYITDGSGFTPTSVVGNVVTQANPWAPTMSGKTYTTQAFFQLTTDCLWGSTLVDPNSLTSTISPNSKTLGTGSTTLTVTLKNRCGGNISGASVTIKKPDGTSVTLTTNSSGVATLTIPDASGSNGSYDTFLGGSATGTPALSPTMTYLAPPVPTSGTINIDTPSNAADGTSSATVTVNIVDQYGNPVPAGTEVCLEKTNGLGTLGNGPWTTDANGQVTTTITSPTTVGAATIKAWIGPCTSKGSEVGPVNIDFIPGAPNPGTSTIGINKSSNPADGTSSATVTVNLVDVNGNPIPAGTEVCLEKTAGPGTLGSGPWITDANGKVTTTITAPDTTGTATITAWVGSCSSKSGEVGPVNIEFTPRTADPSHSSVTANKTKTPADGTSVTEVTVKILDVNGNPLPAGASVCLVKTAGSGTLGDGPWATDANGNVTTTLTSPALPGSGTVTAYVGDCSNRGASVGAVTVHYSKVSGSLAFTGSSIDAELLLTLGSALFISGLTITFRPRKRTQRKQ